MKYFYLLAVGSLSCVFALNYRPLVGTKQTVLAERIFKQWCPCSYRKCYTFNYRSYDI